MIYVKELTYTTLHHGFFDVPACLDRLARSTRDLLNIHLARPSSRWLMGWADTSTAHGKLMITILGGLAEFEHSLIKARADVGIRRAREAGVKFGRPLKHQRQQANCSIRVSRREQWRACLMSIRAR
jgi:DNA invertase Pin-like site-specific DNA recombinase